MKIRLAKKKLKALYKEILKFKLQQDSLSPLDHYIGINRLCWEASDIRDSVSNKDVPRVESYEEKLRKFDL